MIVTVMFLTYASALKSDRSSYARACLGSLLERLTFKGGELRWHIADDGSDKEHIEALIDLCREHGAEPTVSVTDHRGYGGNYNLACQSVHDSTDLVLPCEDDWELMRPFDLSDIARALWEGSQLDEMHCIRLGYLGWSNELRGRLVQYAAQTFLLFDSDSTEVHVLAGHPRLETVAFERAVGPWPEGMKAGYTELEVCNRITSRRGVAWPLDADVNASQDYCRLFAHVGEVQA